jgi:hypothetical protein
MAEGIKLREIDQKTLSDLGLRGMALLTGDKLIQIGHGVGMKKIIRTIPHPERKKKGVNLE